jgi:hypothetical protein
VESRVLQWVPIPMGTQYPPIPMGKWVGNGYGLGRMGGYWVGMRDPGFTTTELADYRATRRIVVRVNGWV